MQDRETALREPCPHCGRTDYRWTNECRVGLSKLEVRCDYCRPLRMDAYYYGFTETGVEAIDRILSAVAHAGKGYHHTESWGDEGLDDMGEFHGGNYVAWIQNAANDAARTLASPLSAPPQEPTGASPQAEMSEDMGDGWYVTVGRWGDSIVTIEQRCLSGKADLSDEDAALIRGAAKHLQAFIGQPAPVSPVEPTTDLAIIEKCNARARQTATFLSNLEGIVRGGDFLLEAERQIAAAMMAAYVMARPASPVEPEPPTLEPCAHELDYHNCAECVGPKVEPEPCVWRGLPYVKTTCGQSRWVPVDLQPLVSSFNKCPYCGAPLKVEREP